VKFPALTLALKVIENSTQVIAVPSISLAMGNVFVRRDECLPFDGHLYVWRVKLKCLLRHTALKLVDPVIQ
jgi:hypothetical protein